MAETNYLKNFIDDEVITASDTNNNNQYLLSQISASNAAMQQYVASQIASVNSSLQTMKMEREKLFPVGSLYIGVGETCPIAEIIGTWVLVTTAKLLQDGSTIKIKGTGAKLGVNNKGDTRSGYLNLYRSSYNEITMPGGGNHGSVYVTTDEGGSGIIANTPVNTFDVNIWKRTE